MTPQAGDPRPASAPPPERATPDPQPARATQVRSLDLLAVDFESSNLTVKTGLAPGARQLVRIRDGDAFIIAHFQAQHIADEAFFEAATEFPTDPPSDPPSDPPPPPPPPPDAVPVNARISGPSRLVFRVPAAMSAIDYTTAGLLAVCQTADLMVVPHARPGPDSAQLAAGPAADSADPEVTGAGHDVGLILQRARDRVRRAAAVPVPHVAHRRRRPGRRAHHSDDLRGGRHQLQPRRPAEGPERLPTWAS